MLGFFNIYRDGKRVTRKTLTDIADQFQNWLKNRSEKWSAPVLDAPEDERRDDFVLPYLKNRELDQVAVILKAREPARILVAIGGENNRAWLFWNDAQLTLNRLVRFAWWRAFTKTGDIRISPVFYGLRRAD